MEKRADGTLRCRFWRDTDDGRTIGCSHVHTSSKKQKMPGGEAFVWLQPGVELQWREAVLERDTAARAAAFQASGTASASPTSHFFDTTLALVDWSQSHWSTASAAGLPLRESRTTLFAPSSTNVRAVSSPMDLFVQQ